MADDWWEIHVSCSDHFRLCVGGASVLNTRLPIVFNCRYIPPLQLKLAKELLASGYNCFLFSSLFQPLQYFDKLHSSCKQCFQCVSFICCRQALSMFCWPPTQWTPPPHLHECSKGKQTAKTFELCMFAVNSPREILSFNPLACAVKLTPNCSQYVGCGFKVQITWLLHW